MPLAGQTKVPKRRSMTDEVYDTLLESITECQLKPGERISAEKLAVSLNVSRTPVREAIKRLEDIGLVESSANRWTRVTEISPADMRMIYPIIWTLECLAVTMAMPRLTDSEIQEMEDQNRLMSRALSEHNRVGAYEADVAFHGVLFKVSGNPYLWEMVEELKIRHRRAEVFFFGGEDFSSESVQEHAAIVSALREGDVDRAKETICNNWKSSMERIFAAHRSRGGNKK